MTEASIKERINLGTRERLKDPIITDLYEGYVQLGILDPLEGVLRQSNSDIEPVIHTLTSHVTKEKPLFVHGLGQAAGLESEDSASIAASVDILWILSLMYDDIVDGDATRAGKPAAWVTYGREATMASAQATLNSLMIFLASRFGPDHARICQTEIQRGLASIEDHEKLQLGCGLYALYKNYDARAGFHCDYPVQVIQQLGHIDVNAGLNALLGVNRAGQILNDEKDMHRGWDWMRTGFTDIRHGLVTVPIELLWQQLQGNEQADFLSMFGQKELSDNEVTFIRELMIKHNLPQQIKDLCEGIYQSSKENYHQVATDPGHHKWFDLWFDYKWHQMQSMSNLS